MKIFFKAISISLFIIFLPVFVYSAVSNFFNFSGKSTTTSSVYDFEAHADVPNGGSSQGAEGGTCQGVEGACCGV